MTELRFLLATVAQTLLRVLPFPCKTGLVTIGKPGRDSPVLLTGNYHLTVQRVRRALKGVDAYLLIANSRGVNVWCAATGGLLTDHDVISVLKTSGIEDLVAHRQVILPQLAATGIQGRIIRKKTGWKVIWGPVYAKSIPAFLNGGFQKTPQMCAVSFLWLQRIEMAVAWAFPISLLSLLVFPFWRQGVFPLFGLVWGLSLLIFLTFPLYQGRLRKPQRHVGFVFFDFGERGILLLFWIFFLSGLVSYTMASHLFSWPLIFRWGLISLIILLILGLDLRGSTPMFKSGLHKERLLRIALNVERCRGVRVCEQVCPTGVFNGQHQRRVATLVRPQQCVQCGACIVQCPFDALYFQSSEGNVITPPTIREFKLNLLGRRYTKLVRTDT